MKVGEQLNTVGNGRTVITELAHFKADLRTCNLTVAEAHTYYVLAGFESCIGAQPARERSKRYHCAGSETA